MSKQDPVDCNQPNSEQTSPSSNIHGNDLIHIQSPYLREPNWKPSRKQPILELPKTLPLYEPEPISLFKRVIAALQLALKVFNVVPDVQLPPLPSSFPATRTPEASHGSNEINLMLLTNIIQKLESIGQRLEKGEDTNTLISELKMTCSELGDLVDDHQRFIEEPQLKKAVEISWENLRYVREQYIEEWKRSSNIDSDKKTRREEVKEMLDLAISVTDALARLREALDTRTSR